MLRCRVVKSYLAAYIHNELPLKARRRVAAHLERCSSCQATYQQQRELARELAHELPRVGQMERGQLARVWSQVQSELHTPTPRPSLHYRASYGMAALMLVVMMLVPYLSSLNDANAAPLRTQPARTVAYSTDVPDERVLHRVPENALNRTAPAVTRIRFTYVTPQAALTPAPLP